MKYNPQSHQKLIIDHIKQTERCAVLSGMGTGKTVSTLTALVELNIWPVLILAPKRVANSTWPDEVAKWDHTKHLKCVSLCGGKKAFDKGIAQKAHIYTINYDNASYIARYKTPVIVFDESTKLKSYRTRQGGKRAKFLYNLAKFADRVILLTGTVAPNGLQDVWGQIAFLDYGFRLGSSYSTFMTRYFHAIKVGRHAMAVKYIPKEGAQSQVEDAIRDLAVTIQAQDHFDLDEPIVSIQEFDLPTKALKTYKEVQNKMLLLLEQAENEENETKYKSIIKNALAKAGTLLQICSGQVYTKDGYEVLHDEKLSVLESIVSEANGAPILVAYNFKSEVERIQGKFKHARLLDSDPETIRDWNRGEIQILLAHPASCGHGLNLAEGGNILVYYTCNFNLEEHEQIKERLGPMRQKQAGLDRPTFIYHIQAKNTIEQRVLESLANKSEVQDNLLKNLKRDQ